MIGYRNASYGAMVLCDNLEGQSVYRKCCGFLIEAMERKLRNRGSLCWTRFPLSEVPRNGLPKESRSTFYIHFVGLTSTNFYTLKVEWWGGNENECKWEFQRQSDGEEKGDFYWIVKRLIKDNGKTISEIAEGLGKSQQSLSQKIIKESMRATELYNIADALGYDIVFKKRDNQ